MKDWEAKKPAMRAAINEIQDLHKYDAEMEWCDCCETRWPCSTLLALNKHIDLELLNPCTYTFSHTKHWCGYPMCREE